jgi:hypothetical protein
MQEAQLGGLGSVNRGIKVQANLGISERPYLNNN